MDQTNQTNETDQITQLGSNVPHYPLEKADLTFWNFTFNYMMGGGFYDSRRTAG